jgi:hypothetical protein
MEPECYVYTNDRDTHGPVCKWCQPKIVLDEGLRWEPVYGDSMAHHSCDQCLDPIHSPTYATDRLFEEVLELLFGEYHNEWNEGRHPIYQWLLDYCCTTHKAWEDWHNDERSECFRSLAQAMWECPRKFHETIP